MIKAENIAAKEFRKSLYGYDCEQVDRYLDELIVQLKQMEQERLEMATTIEYLVGQLQGDPIGIPEAADIVAPVSPHELLSDTGRQRLAESAQDPSAKPFAPERRIPTGDLTPPEPPKPEEPVPQDSEPFGTESADDQPKQSDET